MKDYISALNVGFSYSENDSPVLTDITLNIEKGSYVAIIGHNGSGKSTLAKLLCGILEPTDGTVTIDGISTADEEKIYTVREKCGMVFQNPDNQLVTSIVEEDVAFAPENLGLPPEEIRARVDDALKAVGMSEYAKHATYKLSGGQKQRVAIAGIFAMLPECIIFDEATAMLDPSGRREISETIKRLNTENKITVITITHFMSEAVEADRVIVLNKGSVFLDGKPKEIFSDVSRLKSVGLSAPQVTELFDRLNGKGAELPVGVLHAMQAADELEKVLK